MERVGDGGMEWDSSLGGYGMDGGGGREGGLGQEADAFVRTLTGAGREYVRNRCGKEEESREGGRTWPDHIGAVRSLLALSLGGRVLPLKDRCTDTSAICPPPFRPSAKDQHVVILGSDRGKGLGTGMAIPPGVTQILF